MIRARTVRAALAGAAAAGAWGAVSPLLSRALRTPYEDVRFLGRLTTRGGDDWKTPGLALHMANGALFGAAFERIGGRGALQGVLAAELENLVLWPTLLVFERIHPDQRSGAWPSFFRDRRAFAHAAITHAMFGALLGDALRDMPRD